MGRDDSSISLVHVFLVSFPGQGHVNPLLRLGKCLASKGLLVTFCTPESWAKQMRKASNITSKEEEKEAAPVAVGGGFMRFESFQDGWGEKEEEAGRYELDQYLPHLEGVGKQVLPAIIQRQEPPVCCLLNNPFIPWVSDVAESLGLPSAMLWVQSCACFSAYYHYFHNLAPFPSEEAGPHIDVQLPCMPLLRYDEVPSFLHPTTPYPFLRRAIMGQYRHLENTFCILMDTFLDLEQHSLDHMSNIFPIKTVGPLFKAAPGSGVRGDLLKADEECMEWLDTKAASSVAYISFGSVVCLKQEQVEEIAYGLVDSGLSFLWVMNKPPRVHALPRGFLENNARAMVVRWSPQERVLSHPSLACFVTHCGWNSSMEALTSGVPIVAFPQWGDQVTNAKYLVDVFKVAVRMCRGEHANQLIKRDEIKRCLLEATVGPEAEEIKRNVLNFKAKAEAALMEGGSSDRNIQAFVDEVRRRSFRDHQQQIGHA